MLFRSTSTTEIYTRRHTLSLHDALPIGNSPARAVDNEPSQTWAALDPTTGALHGTLPSNAGLADVKFTGGPTLDRSLPIDMTQSPSIQIQRGKDVFTIQSMRGVITIQDPPGQGSTGAQRVVGAGIALAATAGGRYIIALAGLLDRKSTRLNSSHVSLSRMPSSA